MLIFYFALALGVSFLCSMLESVLLSTTQSHAHMLERDGKLAGRRWLKLKDHDAIEPLTAILTLNTIAHTVGALGVGVEVESVFPGQYTVAIASAVLTMAILLLSEILPKTIGAAYWKQLSSVAASLLVWLVRLLRPFVMLILALKKLFPSPDKHVVTRDELAALADIGESEGTIAEDEEAVISNVLNLRNIAVTEIMTPRVVIDSWSIDCSVRDALDTSNLAFSRIPIYNETIDDVRGFVLRTDILLAAADGDWDRPIRDFAKPAPSVNGEATVDTVFKDLLHSRSHLAVVTDEFGGTAGLVTLEDVIETLLGEEIVDEVDEVDDMRELAREQAGEKSDCGMQDPAPMENGMRQPPLAPKGSPEGA